MILEEIALNIKIPEKPGIPVHYKILKYNTFTAIVNFFIVSVTIVHTVGH